jgi:hypothetical protein
VPEGRRQRQTGTPTARGLTRIRAAPARTRSRATPSLRAHASFPPSAPASWRALDSQVAASSASSRSPAGSSATSRGWCSRYSHGRRWTRRLHGACGGAAPTCGSRINRRGPPMAGRHRACTSIRIVVTLTALGPLGPCSASDHVRRERRLLVAGRGRGGVLRWSRGFTRRTRPANPLHTGRSEGVGSYEACPGRPAWTLGPLRTSRTPAPARLASPWGGGQASGILRMGRAPGDPSTLRRRLRSCGQQSRPESGDTPSPQITRRGNAP